MPRRQYTPEYKKRAIQLCLEPGRTIAGIARDLGIPENNLQRWRKTCAVIDPSKEEGGPDGLSAQKRIKELERELTWTREERDILKKTIGIFSRSKRDTP